MDPAELRNRFAYHPADTPVRVAAHTFIRALLTDVSVRLNELLPDSREKSLAMTHLDDVGHWANKTVAMHFPHGDGTPIKQEG
jgi:hypothetical protein